MSKIQDEKKPSASTAMKLDDDMMEQVSGGLWWFTTSAKGASASGGGIGKKYHYQCNCCPYFWDSENISIQCPMCGATEIYEKKDL